MKMSFWSTVVGLGDIAGEGVEDAVADGVADGVRVRDPEVGDATLSPPQATNNGTSPTVRMLAVSRLIERMVLRGRGRNIC
jgi:hypothetical protein